MLRTFRQIIHDEDMNLSPPSRARPDTRADLAFMCSVIKHAQITSSVERNLLNPRFEARPLDEIKNTVNRLDHELRSWHAELSPEYRLSTTNRFGHTCSTPNVILILYIQHCFHGSLCVIHNKITQPWKSNRFLQSRNPEHIVQVQESLQIISEASRHIILQSQQYEVNAASPVW